MATAEANASLVGYAQYLDWEFYLKKSGWWYKLAALVLLSYLVLLLIGSIANIFGLKEINWVTGFVIQMAVLVFMGNPFNFIAVGGAGFVRGQAGGEVGPSANDGFKTGWDWASGFGRFVLYLGGVYAPVAFYTIAIWSIRPAPFLAFILLVASVGLAITSALIFKGAKFFINLMWLIYLVMVLGILLYFTAPNQVQRKLDWMEARLSVNQADRASDATDAKIRQDAIEKADACFRALTPQSTAYQRELCESLKRNAGHLVYQDEAAIASHQAMERLYAAGMQRAVECYNALQIDATRADKEKCDQLREEARRVLKDSPPAPTKATPTAERTAPALTPAPAAPVRTSKIDVPWDCNTTVKTVEYAPGWNGSEGNGRFAIGTLPAGRYEIRVAGKRLQPFYTGTPAVLEQICEIDPEGRLGICRDPQGKEVRNMNGTPWIPPANQIGRVPVLLSKTENMVAPYGMVVVYAWERPLAIGANGRIESSTDLELALDVNNFQTPLNYKSQGSLQVEIKQCQTT